MPRHIRPGQTQTLCQYLIPLALAGVDMTVEFRRLSTAESLRRTLETYDREMRRINRLPPNWRYIL